jgi:hypothetical protein
LLAPRRRCAAQAAHASHDRPHRSLAPSSAPPLFFRARCCAARAAPRSLCYCVLV